MNPVTFFYRHAGYSYPAGTTPAAQRAHRLNCARRLASAEGRAREEGLSFDWDVDPDQDSSEWSDERPAWPQWRCIVYNADGVSVASLWGIDFGRDGTPWGDPYRRVVEAELAAEVLK
jgi:hypothetical protein